ncbi:26S protease regulatory subunit 4 [Tupaia chinensis]|uniref:26S protease regulatory subunit 4 n=1 Tax=Tupaia chinensis TaxID=246437 RepID=L9KGZ6_TUPCH|nr:26S protease regulatory subunit 4 [Tupaia chinensis]
MSVGTLEEVIDDSCAIVFTSVGSEHYVSILSFVDKDLLEPGCSVLPVGTRLLGPAQPQGACSDGVLRDDTDPLVTGMRVEKAPQETYADTGGLDNQIQESKESVELPLTHPEYYEEMVIKPPRGSFSLVPLAQVHPAPGPGTPLPDVSALQFRSLERRPQTGMFFSLNPQSLAQRK